MAAFLFFISVEGCHRKTTNAFGISRASVSATIKRVSYSIKNFLGPKLMKLPTTVSNVKELTNLGTREMGQ